MVLPASSFFAAPTKQKIRAPMLNSVPFTGQGNTGFLSGPQINYRTFWQWFKTRPELIAVLSVPITDILGDRPIFTNPDGTPLGRNKLIKAKKFWRDNMMKDNIKGMLYDSFITGDGYLWKGKFSAEDRIDKVKEMLSNYSKLLSASQYNELMIKATQDEDLRRTKIINYVASQTVTIIHDQFDVLGYVQNVNGKISKFSTDEIIHHRYMNIDGRVEGFSPVQSLTAEITLLLLVKENMLAYMRNGGSPAKVFSLPEELANSDNHKFLVQTLQKYNAIENRNGNLVFTGKIDINDLSGTPKDLEYKELALYITSNIAFAYGIPVTRIPYLIGAAANKGDSGGLSESGYWNRISEVQDEMEDLLNSQLFEEMGFMMKFVRKYKQDEVREAQISSMNADTITKIQSILKSKNKTLDENTIAQFLNISPSSFQEMTDEEKFGQLEKTGLMNQNLMDNMTLNSEQDKLKRADTKRNVANQAVNKSASV